MHAITRGGVQLSMHVDLPSLWNILSHPVSLQEWDTIIVLQFPDGCPMQPADFAKNVAQDRLSLRLQPGSSLPGAKAHMSKL